MSYIYPTQEAVNKVIKYLKDNQYVYSVQKYNNIWLVRIKD